MVDRFSKSCHLIPLKRLPTAMETSELMFNHVFRYFGIPEDIVSDRGPQFVTGLEELLQTPRCDRKFIVWLPSSDQWADGEKDSRNLTFPANLLPRPPAFLEPVHWLGRVRSEFPPAIIYWNTFQCVLGYQPPMSPWDGEPSDVPAVDYWFRESERVWDEAHHHLQRALRRRKMTADLRRSDAPSYQPGQKVWLSTRDIRLCLPCKKLTPRFVGPFTFQKQINPVTFQLNIPPQYRIHSTFHVSLLKPYHSPISPSTEPGLITETPLPLIQEDEAIYEVRAILDS